MTDLVIGVDPGTTKSAYVAWDGASIHEIGTEANPQVAKYLRSTQARTALRTVVVFESIESYGMAVGREIFETIFWTGRMFQIARDTIGPKNVYRLPRRAIKKHLCRSNRVKDKHIRAALLKRFENQHWEKLITSHQWAALAVAVTWWDTERARHSTRG